MLPATRFKPPLELRVRSAYRKTILASTNQSSMLLTAVIKSTRKYKLATPVQILDSASKKEPTAGLS